MAPPRIQTPSGPLTNIGASVPPRALPVARHAADGGVVNPDPQWISRWQNSKTRPLSKAPWVIGYRWWEAGAAFRTWGPNTTYRIDLKWRDHMHAYYGIPLALWQEFRDLRTSVGSWFHKKVLGPNWSPGKGAMFPNFPL